MNLIERLKEYATDWRLRAGSEAIVHEAIAKIETDAKVIAEKDIEIRSMIAVHNSDIDGMRMQEEKIADQKQVIAALREALSQIESMAQNAFDGPDGVAQIVALRDIITIADAVQPRTDE
jgi:hypothetical protein